MRKKNKEFGKLGSWKVGKLWPCIVTICCMCKFLFTFSLAVLWGPEGLELKEGSLILSRGKLTPSKIKKSI